MKLKIKIKQTHPYRIETFKKGDWIDLPLAEEARMFKGGYQLLNLGAAMELPKGYEAYVLPRSSTAREWSIMMANSIGIIDNTYCGNEDFWKFPAYAMYDTVIPAGTRIAQFRIQLSQQATVWQKLKWLFCSKVELEFVPYLHGPNRGGLGSTGR